MSQPFSDLFCYKVSSKTYPRNMLYLSYFVRKLTQFCSFSYTYMAWLSLYKCKGDALAQSWHGIVRAAGPNPFGYWKPQPHLLLKPQCGTTGVDFDWFYINRHMYTYVLFSWTLRRDILVRAERLINLKIPALVQSLKSSNIEFG